MDRLIGAGLVKVFVRNAALGQYRVLLSDKGKLFIDGWKRGDQSAAVNAGLIPAV
jgi:hypothetical protein